MNKYIILFVLLLSIIGSAIAEPIKITPIKKISTTKKSFSVGNKYEFKNVNSDEKYTGEIVYYKPNGFYGEEAQLEISNFENSLGERIPGKVTIVPANHKNFQEYANHCSIGLSHYIRGSEIILKPKKDEFLINNIKPETHGEEIIRIVPKTMLSTVHDELEIGDKIEFIIKNNIYKNGKLFIKSQTPIIGTIDYLDENGWCADNAAIYIKDFVTQDADGNVVNINSSLKIDGFELLKYKSNRKAQFFNYISTPVRGKEIDIKPTDTNIQFNIPYKF